MTCAVSSQAQKASRLYAPLVLWVQVSHKYVSRVAHVGLCEVFSAAVSFTPIVALWGGCYVRWCADDA
jgi:hypothetical protein